MTARFALLILLAGAAGCATWFDRINYFNMAPRLEYQGFSFDRPPNPYWYFLQSEQSYTQVVLRRDFFTPSKTHTFYALVGLGQIASQPKTHEEFAELARSPYQRAAYEVRTVSYEQRPTTRQGQWCIRFESSYAAIGAPPAPDRELSMILRGYRCLHPTWPRTTLDFYYSERGLADEMDAELHEEGEQFLNGVRIDVAPGTPAASAKIPGWSGRGLIP